MSDGLTGLTLSEDESKALRNFLQVWGDGYLANDLGEKLTCIEADAIAGLFGTFGEDEASYQWISSHSYSDDEGDSHYQGEIDE